MCADISRRAIKALSPYSIEFAASDNKGTSRMQPHLGGLLRLYQHADGSILFSDI
jgi:hypothetical protein